MFKLPLIRYSILSLLLLSALFLNFFTVGLFFFLGITFSAIEKFLSYKKYDKQTNNIFIDFGWVPILLVTFIIIYIYRDLII